jgi:hypothetical protein
MMNINDNHRTLSIMKSFLGFRDDVRGGQRHGRASLPDWVSKILAELLQAKVRKAHEAQQDFRYFLLEPPKPRRPLSGCCAGYIRKSEIPRFW